MARAFPLVNLVEIPILCPSRSWDVQLPAVGTRGPRRFVSNPQPSRATSFLFRLCPSAFQLDPVIQQGVKSEMLLAVSRFDPPHAFPAVDNRNKFGARNVNF